jgi:hypothetical protein
MMHNVQIVKIKIKKLLSSTHDIVRKHVGIPILCVCFIKHIKNN